MPLGITRTFAAGQPSCSARYRPCGRATATKASVSGASRRLDRSTWSGRPVEWIAEQITGTPASQAARRPQNILSPGPTVTTASIRRRRKRPRQPPEDGEIVLVAEQARVGGNLPGEFRPQRPEFLQAAQFRQEPRAIEPADQLDQQGLRAAHRHARQDEHDPQRTAILKQS